MALRGRPPKAKPSIDFSLLSEDEQIKLRAAAKAKVDDEAKDAAEKAFLARALDEERASRGIGDGNEETYPYLIDLPGFADKVMVDGRQFIHGGTYQFTLDQLASIKEIVARAWEHEAEIGGANRDAYRKPREAVLRNPH